MSGRVGGRPTVQSGPGKTAAVGAVVGGWVGVAGEISVAVGVLSAGIWLGSAVGKATTTVVGNIVAMGCCGAAQAVIKVRLTIMNKMF
jgi:hypothetical protein